MINDAIRKARKSPLFSAFFKVKEEPTEGTHKTYKYDKDCKCGLMLHTKEEECPRCNLKK